MLFRSDDSLVDKLADHLGGDMQKLALRLLKGKRDTDAGGDDDVDEGLARKQAHQLKDGLADFIEVLCDNSPKQNAAMGKYFEETYDMSLKRAISNEFSGPVKNALLALLTGPTEWYAAQLKAALSGDEVDHKKVCRIIGAHDKEAIKEIAEAYDKKYGVTLKTAVTKAVTRVVTGAVMGGVKAMPTTITVLTAAVTSVMRLNMVAAQLSGEMLQRERELFQKLDLDGSGQISADELLQAFLVDFDEGLGRDLLCALVL